MRQTPSETTRDTLSLKLGTWFEAHATGRGVIAMVVVVALLGLIALMKLIAN